jgi:SnoaL-like domain
MNPAADRVPRAPSAAITAVGIDHIRLHYLYLDNGDVDGYLSLLAMDAVLRLPGRPQLCGLEQIGAYRAAHGRAMGEHVLYDVFGSDDHLVAEGRLHLGGVGRDMEFSETFRLNDDGLLRSQKIYFFVEPG